MRALTLLLLLLPFPLAAQQDPAAREILDRVAASTKLYKTMQLDFKIVVADHKEDKKSTSSGSLLIKGDKYRLTSAGTTVYFDGKTMWTYVQEDNEVTITEPDNQDDNFLSNPAKVFSWYNRDFKYQYHGETSIDGVAMHEIDLFPKNLDQPYARIKVFITKNKEELAIISSVGKDGVDYSIFLTNLLTNKEFGDTIFTFDPARQKKVTIVDMRGL